MTVLNKIRRVTDLPMLVLALALGAGSFILLVVYEPDVPAEEMGAAINEAAEESGAAMDAATD